MSSKATMMSIIAAMLIISIAPALGHPSINHADITYTPGVEINEARIETDSNIATNGSQGAYGYGILTGGDSIIVTTTHAGVHDSEDQTDGNAR